MALWRGVRRIYRQIRARRYSYERQVEVRIRRQNLLENLQTFSELCAPAQVAPVLKGNAYGHGLTQVARILDGQECPFMVVDGYHEALILRNEGIRTPLVVMGYTPQANIRGSKLKHVAYMVASLAHLRKLCSVRQPRVHLHLKLNTGLNRYGIQPDEIADALSLFERHPNLVLEGVCSHLADASSRNAVLTHEQISLWNRLVHTFPKSNIHLHLANTAGTYWSRDFTATVTRVGLGLYGIDTHPTRHLPLRPALSVRSRIGSVFEVPKGASVGYGRSWTASEARLIATLPTGYNSCVDDRLSDNGVVTVAGHHCPIVGRVCMNATMIDVTCVPQVKAGQEVTIISADSDEPNSIKKVARRCNTSCHAILTGLSPSLRRVVT